jgi:hypothetical protein
MEIDVKTIQQEIEKNPVGFMLAASGLLMGLAKIVQAVGDSRGSHAYARDVNRRIRASKKR